MLWVFFTGGSKGGGISRKIGHHSMMILLPSSFISRKIEHHFIMVPLPSSFISRTIEHHSIMIPLPFSFISRIEHHSMMILLPSSLISRKIEHHFIMIPLPSRFISRIEHDSSALQSYTKKKYVWTNHLKIPICNFQEHITMCYSFYLLFTDHPSGWHPTSWQDVFHF